MNRTCLLFSSLGGGGQAGRTTSTDACSRHNRISGRGGQLQKRAHGLQCLDGLPVLVLAKPLVPVAEPYVKVLLSFNRLLCAFSCDRRKRGRDTLICTGISQRVKMDLNPWPGPAKRSCYLP